MSALAYEEREQRRESAQKGIQNKYHTVVVSARANTPSLCMGSIGFDVSGVAAVRPDRLFF